MDIFSHQSNIQREETVEESEIQQREGSFYLNEEFDAENQTTSSRCTSPSNLAPKVKQRKDDPIGTALLDLAKQQMELSKVETEDQLFGKSVGMALDRLLPAK